MMIKNIAVWNNLALVLQNIYKLSNTIVKPSKSGKMNWRCGSSLLITQQQKLPWFFTKTSRYVDSKCTILLLEIIWLEKTWNSLKIWIIHQKILEFIVKWWNQALFNEGHVRSDASEPYTLFSITSASFWDSFKEVQFLKKLRGINISFCPMWVNTDFNPWFH
mgnify:CR=1 FL=1